MQLRRPGIHALIAIQLILAAPAVADKAAPVVWPAPAPAGTAVDGITGGACASGIHAAWEVIFGYVEPPDDAYYTLITPAACEGCPTGQRTLTTAHALLYCNSACQIPLQVSIVPAIALGNGCLAPDAFATPITEPVSYMIGMQTMNRCVDYAFALPPGACLDGPAFLRLEFDDGTCPNYLPGFCGTESCAACTQYNVYPGIAAPGRDLCDAAGKGAIMNVEMTCCAATTIAPGTWGRVKSLYR